MSSEAEPGCRFCLGNALLIDTPILSRDQFFLLGSIDPERRAQVMIVPHRHVETPFELNAPEWAELGTMLDLARAHLAQFRPDGFTIGWNVGGVAGQEVFHAHLHVIVRFAGEPRAGKGIHAALKALNG
jgi:diadenosine tetraphosphate (Ap4A) HIT family hydrolase